MHSFIKQSTASQSRSIGPFVDDTDFKTAETGLTIANTDIKLMINGAASANKNSGGGTHRANGVYGLTFDATDTATVGEIFVSVVVAGALPVFATFVVLEEAVYDALFAASAPGYGTAQTGDSFARLGAPAGASVSADVAGVQSDTNDIQTRIPAALVSGRIDASVGAMASGVLTATAIAADAITAAKIADGAIDAATFAAGAINAAAIASDAITDAKVASDVTIASVTGAVGSVTGAVGSVTGNVGGSVASVAAGGITASSIAADAIGASELAADAVTEIAAGVLAAVVEGSITVAQSLRLSNAGIGGKASGLATATAVYRDAGDSKDRITATVDASGNRTAVTLDLT